MVKYFCFGLLLTIVVSFTPVFGDTNVLKNPGFENGTDGWSERGCKIEAVTTPVHSGTKAAKAIERKDTWQGIKQSLIGKVVIGKTYKTSGWVKLENSDNDNITLSIEQEDENGTKYINLETLTVNNTAWTEVSGEFTPSPSGTLTTLDVYFEGPAQDVNFFVDDVNVFGPAATAQAEPNTPKAKAEPNAPKAEPNAPAKDIKEKAPEAKSGIITDSAVVNTKNEAVIDRQ